ncbi:E6 [Fulmarus glacialis papillomavirus 1]|uniref:E6 n=1 Tax=Fulmarus glacialis papillomavirus 1 TaxID=1463817 RepID=A0A059TB35_9PAPI|nr:E6 [Fulmarus glacialis papillomavirus 1]AHV82115.1 E6 [Fulmarus glacialis papillomavirus 1]
MGLCKSKAYTKEELEAKAGSLRTRQIICRLCGANLHQYEIDEYRTKTLTVRGNTVKGYCTWCILIVRSGYWDDCRREYAANI